MYRYRVLMMLAALLATAAAAHGQPAEHTPPPKVIYYPPPTPPVQIPAQPPEIVTPGDIEFGVEIGLGQVYGTEPGWHIQACQQAVTAWQRVRAICTANQENAACCDAASKAANCALGVAGSVNCCQAVQAPKACACVKACACCEACKASKDASARTQAQQMTAEMMRRFAGLHGVAPQPCPIAVTPFPAFPQCLPPDHGGGIVQIVPVPGDCIRIVQMVQVAHHTQPVHFVTPELEAHCQRMRHQGDMVVLEGSVLLLCKKHAQPIRIEAQRVIVNMRDGSFTVDSNAAPMPISSFGIQRTSATEPMGQPRTNTFQLNERCFEVPAPPLAIPTRSVEPQRPGGINAEELFHHLMRYYR